MTTTQSPPTMIVYFLTRLERGRITILGRSLKKGMLLDLYPGYKADGYKLERPEFGSNRCTQLNQIYRAAVNAERVVK